MRVASDKLGASLSKELAPHYLVSGDETLLVEEACDQIRAAAKRAGFDRQVFSADKGFSWDDLYAESRERSLFSSRRLFEIRLPTGKAEKKGTDLLLALVKNPDPELLLLVITNKLDRKTSEAGWITELGQRGVAVTVWPVAAAEMPSWLQIRANSCGYELAADAAGLIARQSEGNLLAAAQELEKLQLLAEAKTIDLSLARSALVNSAKFDVFAVAEAAAAGDSRRALCTILSLQEEGAEPTLLLWALIREIRGLWQSREQTRLGFGSRSNWNIASTPGPDAAQRAALLPLERLLEAAASVDLVVKGQVQGDPWAALTALTLVLAGGLPVSLLTGKGRVTSSAYS